MLIGITPSTVPNTMRRKIRQQKSEPILQQLKSWLFSDTPKGAHASALLYSLIETAKANGQEPYAWFADTEAAENTARHAAQSAGERLAEASQALQQLQSDFDRRRQLVAAGLQPLGIETVPDQAIDTLLEELSGRLRAWQSRAARKLEIERQIAELSSDLRRLDGLVESANAALAGRTQRLEVLTREREEQAARRQELFGERDPGAEEQGLPTNGRRCPCWRGAYNAEDKLKSWAPVCGLPDAIPLRPASRSSLMLST